METDEVTMTINWFPLIKMFWTNKRAHISSATLHTVCRKRWSGNSPPRATPHPTTPPPTLLLSSSFYPPARSHPPQRSHLKCDRAAGAKANRQTDSEQPGRSCRSFFFGSAVRYRRRRRGEWDTGACESGLRVVGTLKDHPTCFQVPFSRQSHVFTADTMGCCSGRCTLIFICTLQLVSGDALVYLFFFCFFFYKFNVFKWIITVFIKTSVSSPAAVGCAVTRWKVKQDLIQRCHYVLKLLWLILQKKVSVFSYTWLIWFKAYILCFMPILRK